MKKKVCGGLKKKTVGKKVRTQNRNTQTSADTEHKGE